MRTNKGGNRMDGQREIQLLSITNCKDAKRIGGQYLSASKAGIPQGIASSNLALSVQCQSHFEIGIVIWELENQN